MDFKGSLVAVLRTIVPWLEKHLFVHKGFLKSYDWLYAPSWSGFLFALRTTIASFLALTIALWLQLDSPKWAAMTVWICARHTSRGETISKANWRAVGTLFGAFSALIFTAMFPQQIWLFYLSICLFLSVCVWFATCTQSFKAYAMALAGYTCAIIAFGSITNPENVFRLAVARTTYILLGVWCESFVSRFFDFNIDRNARAQLNDNLLTAIKGTLRSVLDMLAGDKMAAFKSQELFKSLTNYNNSIEFRQIEMSGNDHTGDHARAALFSVTAVLTRSVGLVTQLRHFDNKIGQFRWMVPKAIDRLNKLLSRVDQGQDFAHEQRRLYALRWECRQKITDSFYPSLSFEGDNSSTYDEDAAFNDRILFRSLSELLGELQVTLEEYYKSNHPSKNDRFRFYVKPPSNYSLAWKNSVRTFVAMLVSCLVWYSTGWSQGPITASLVGMGCARYCLFENPSPVAFNWLKGTLYALFIGLVLNFYFIPMTENIEIVYLMLFLPTFISGLGIASPKTVSIAVAFAAFFPYMVPLDNKMLVNEITFSNDSLSLLLAIVFVVLSFRLIYPYSPLDTRLHLRQTLLNNLRSIPTTSKKSPRVWLFQTADLLATVLRQLNTTKNTSVVQAYHSGTMAVMLIGLNVLRLRSMVEHDIVTEDIRTLLRIVLKRISQFTGKYGRTVAISHRVTQKLRQKFKTEKNLSVRMEIIAAISCLVVIADSLENNKEFLDVNHLFLFNEKWDE